MPRLIHVVLVAHVIPVALCLGGAVAAEPAPPRPADAVAGVQAVIDGFQAALRTHDASAMDALFLPGQTAWMSALTGAAYRRAQTQKPDAPRFKRSDYQQFVRLVGDKHGAIEERFYHVRIDADDAVAVVSFDFDFLESGRITNQGKETWQLVRTDNGWKISSMLYSSSGPPQAR